MTEKNHRIVGSPSDRHRFDCIARRKRRVARNTFSAELNGPVGSIEQMVLLQVALHQIYCVTGQTPEEMVDLLEHGGL